MVPEARGFDGPRLSPDGKRVAYSVWTHGGYRDIRVEYRDFLLPGIPDVLITPSIVVGAILERIPLVRMLSQSIFISAAV